MEMKTFSIGEGKEVIAVAPAVFQNHIVVTYKHGVYVYNIFTGNCTSSYPSTKMHSVRAIQTNGNKKFYFAQNKSSLNVLNSAMAKPTIVKLEDGTIRNLFPVCPKTGEFVVLTEKGTVLLFGENDSKNVAKLESELDNIDYPIIWADMFVARTMATMLVLRENDEVHGDHILEVYEIHVDKLGSEIVLSASHHFTSEKIKTCAFCSSSLSFTVLTINEVLRVYTFFKDDIFEHGGMMSEKEVNLDYFDLSKGIGAIYLNSHQMALVGYKKNKNQAILTLWDTNFLVVQAKKKLVPEINAHQLNNIIQVSTDSAKNLIYVAFQNAIMVSPLFCPEPSLATALGRYAMTTPVLQETENDTTCFSHFGLRDFLNEKNSDAEVMTPESWSEKTAEKYQIDNLLVKKLLDPNTDSKTFALTLKEYLKLHKKKLKGKSHETVQLYLKKKRWNNLRDLLQKETQLNNMILAHNDRLSPIPLLPHEFVLSVGTRCLNEGLWQSLANLIKHSQSCISIPGIVNKILEEQEIGLLSQFLLNMTAVKENEIQSILCYLLECDKKILVDFITNPRRFKYRIFTKDQWERFSLKIKVMTEQEAFYLFLDLLVSLDFNENLMQKSLKTLKSDHILVLLPYFMEWLATYREHTDLIISQRLSIRIPTSHQILNWLNLIIDAHFVHMVSVPEFHPYIYQLQDQVKLVHNDVDFLLPLWSTLTHFLEPIKDYEQIEGSDYRIEYMLL